MGFYLISIMKNINIIWDRINEYYNNKYSSEDSRYNFDSNKISF